MKFRNLFLIFCILSFAGCTTNNNVSIVGTWRLKEIKVKCSNEVLQANFGQNSEVDGETILEFHKDSSYKKTSVNQHYVSSDDNRIGSYKLKDSLLILDYDTIIINNLTSNGFSLVHKNTVTREVPPYGHCDNYNYYERIDSSLKVSK